MRNERPPLTPHANRPTPHVSIPHSEFHVAVLLPSPLRGGAGGGVAFKDNLSPQPPSLRGKGEKTPHYFDSPSSSLISGRNSEITIAPMVKPRNTIMIGSSSEISDFTSVSTHSS